MPIVKDTYYHHYSEKGESRRPPVILIHGAGGTHLSWPPDIRRLPGFQVFALDLPGHGKSGGRGYQSIGDYAQAIIEWLEVIGIYSASFIGHSMGSAIALTITLNYPEHVKGVGVISGGAQLRVNPELLERLCNPTTIRTTIERIASLSFGAKTPKKLIDQTINRMDETRPSVLYGDFLACNSFDVIGQIAQINLPTLIICGSEDRMTPIRYAQYLASNIPKADIRTVMDSGHMVMLEQPQVVAKFLSDFLGGISYN